MASRPRALPVLALLLLTVAAAAQTVPDFAATPTAGTQALEVQFANLTTSDTTAVFYTWDFGDGSPTTSEFEPLHVYTEPGSYTVSLEAWPLIPFGQDPVTETKVGFITVTAGTLSVDFAAAPTTGPLPLAVQFTAQLDGTAQVTGLQWDFGDGATSTETDPLHTYTTLGPHTVTLTATAGGLEVAETRTDLVQPSAPTLQAAFALAAPAAPAGTPIPFSDTSVSDSAITGWLWDFGDGTTSTEQHPQHAYELAGVFDVSLTVSLLDYADTVVRERAVRVVAPDLQAAFTATPAEGAAPLTVLFEDASPTPATEWYWKIGDIAASHGSQQSLEQTFVVPGTYEVKFTIRVGEWSDVATGSVTVLDPALQAGLDFFPRAGLAPLTVDFVDTSTGLGDYVRTVDFGDGSTSPEHDPSHVYDLDGWYTVTQDVDTVPFSPLYDDQVVYPAAIRAVDPAAVLALPEFGGPQVMDPSSAPDLVTGDLDGDGLPDLVHRQLVDLRVALQQDGVFVTEAIHDTIYPSWIELADMDGDGLLDVVVVQQGPPAVQIWTGDGAGGLALGFDALVPGSADLGWAVVVDADEDGDPDVALGSDPASSVDVDQLRLLWNDGAGALDVDTPHGIDMEFDSGPLLADVNGDGHLDLVGGEHVGTLHGKVALGDGATFGLPQTFDTGLLKSTRFDVGEVTGDGHADVVYAGVDHIWVAPGAPGGPSGVVPAGAAPDVSSLRLRDLDGDGDDDLLGGTKHGTLVVGRLGAGGGYDLWTQLQPAKPFGVFVRSFWCDLDADGDADVLYVGADTQLERLDNLGFVGRWADVGGGTSGTAGAPRLQGAGDLRPGSDVSLTLTDAAPLSAAWLVLGLSDLLVPFQGGVLVPQADVVVGGLVTDGQGGLQLDGGWPLDVPGGTPSWYQLWVVEPGGLVGSNGLLAVSVD